MFKLMSKEINEILGVQTILIWTYARSTQCVLEGACGFIRLSMVSSIMNFIKFIIEKCDTMTLKV